MIVTKQDKDIAFNKFLEVLAMFDLMGDREYAAFIGKSLNRLLNEFLLDKTGLTV